MGLGFGCDDAPLDGFCEWIIERYFDEPQAFAIDGLVKRIPQCASRENRARVQAIQDILSQFIEKKSQPTSM